MKDQAKCAESTSSRAFPKAVNTISAERRLKII